MVGLAVWSGWRRSPSLSTASLRFSLSSVIICLLLPPSGRTAATSGRFNCCRCSRTNLSHYWVVQQGGTSAPNPVFPAGQSIKNECPWLLLVVGGRTQLQKKGFTQFPNCTRNLLSLPLLVVVVHRFCTIFRAHPHILKRSRFSPRWEFERWSQ